MKHLPERSYWEIENRKRVRGKRLSFFRAPKDYSDYVFWRARHQEMAIYTMIAAAAVAFFRWWI